VNANGVIDIVYAGTNYVYQNGRNGGWMSVPCQHEQGVDIDHSALGAITVQLFPYYDTPNPGGVYKVWVTPVANYAGDPSFVPTGRRDPVNGENWQPGNVHGFIPAWSKTDNYKVRKRGRPVDAPLLTIRKFHDKNIDGIQDSPGEEDVTGWEVSVTDPTPVTNTVYTPAEVLAALTGIYTIVEATPAGTLQTVSILDSTNDSFYPTASPTVLVTVLGDDGETHEVVYGNVGLGSIQACKIFDRDGDGVVDSTEPGVSGWKMELNGTDVTGATVGPIVQTTGSNGCTTFANLLPGTYTVTEGEANNWTRTGPLYITETITSSLSGSVISGDTPTISFTNRCFDEADFGTKGYWHNKNGLAELTQADIDYVNGLLPYSTPSSYFGAGDEPFDGYFTGGQPVAAAFHNDDLSAAVSAQAGTPKAEVSHFLVDPNAGGDPREQLAQQLLAFIFNVIHRLGGTDAVVVLPGGSFSAQYLIDSAIAAWAGSDAVLQNYLKDLLDELNNDDQVVFAPVVPCAIVFD
jgi:hypothetical protein